MTKLEKTIATHLQGNSFTEYNHMELEKLETDRAVFRLEIRPESLNPYGMVHGGAIYTLCDNATGFAAHTDGRPYVTQNSTLSFLGNQGKGVIRADARVRHRGRATCLLSVDVTGEGGKPIATGEYTYFCLEGRMGK